MRLKQRLMPVVLAVTALAAFQTACGQETNRPSDGGIGRLFSRPGQSLAHPVVRAQNGMPAPPPGGFLPGGAATGDYYDPTAVQGIPPNPGTQPWPGISLFGERMRRLENVDGLWQYETRNEPRRFFGEIGAMIFELRKPERDLFGDPLVLARIGAQGRDFVRFGEKSSNGDSSFSHEMNSEGLKLRWGFWDADETGFEAIAWYATERFTRDRRFPDFNPFAPPPFMPRGPVVAADDGMGGTVLFFDGNFNLRYSQQAANFHFHRMLPPFFSWNHDSFVVRPMWGARYTFLKERMTFGGFDFFPTDPIGTSLDSRVRSNMAGPVLGLHYTLGSDLLLFTFKSSFIFFVNHQERDLEGVGWADIFTRPDGFVGAFSHSDSSTHFSLGFEQTVHLEIPIFKYVPYLNRSEFFRDAKLRGGVTYMWIDEVSRPNRTVTYNTFPRTPQLTGKRDAWSFIAYDVGVMFQW